jgi:hypothetical protein
LLAIDYRDGVYVCPGRVTSVAGGVHNFVKVIDRELCRVCFDGWEAVAEFNDGPVECSAGGTSYQ